MLKLFFSCVKENDILAIHNTKLIIFKKKEIDRKKEKPNCLNTFLEFDLTIKVKYKLQIIQF